MRPRVVLFLAIVCASLCACGDASPPLFSGPATGYLTTLDQLASPDFNVIEAPHDVDATALGNGDANRAAAAAKSGLVEAASARYFRTTASLAESNGPIDVVTTAARFSTRDGAHAFMATAAAALDAEHNASPVSAGIIGDESHAVTVVATAPGGVQAIQISIAWRNGNVVNIIAVRGRYGGARLDDALYVARQQQLNEAA